MPINIYTVSNHLSENGWKLLSTEYKNLKTDLRMVCPEGHEVEQTYDEWRKHKRCEKCVAGDQYKIKSKKVPPKRIDVRRVLALDAATNITGFSIYDNKELVSYGTFKATSQLDSTERINQVKHWLEMAIEEWQPDDVCIENIQLQTFGPKNSPQVEMYRTLACLQGVLVDTLFERKIPVELVYSSTWREVVGVLGKGRENKKQEAQKKVESWYSIKCSQDEADAICIGKYFILKNKKSSWGEKDL